MKKKLLVICTPECRIEAQNRIAGWSDAPLSAKGLAQLVRIKEALNQEMPELEKGAKYVITSNQLRAEECAGMLFNQIDERKTCWRQRNYGWLEGEDQSLKKLEETPEKFWSIFQGESAEDLKARVLEGFHALSHFSQKCNSSDDLTIILVTHSWPFEILEEIANIKEEEKADPQNTIMVYKLDQGKLSCERKISLEERV